MSESAELAVYHQKRADKLKPSYIPKPYISPFRGQELHACFSRYVKASDAELVFINYVSDNSAFNSFIDRVKSWHKLTCSIYGVCYVKPVQVCIIGTETRGPESQLYYYANATHEFVLLLLS